MALAVPWAGGQHWDVPALSIPDMARTHGLANALAFVGCGLVGQRLARRLHDPCAGQKPDMPKVDPSTGEPMSDAPDGPDDQRGGKGIGDPSLAGSTPSGSPDDDAIDNDSRLSGEKPSIQ